jgi:hypothetical protein
MPQPLFTVPSKGEENDGLLIGVFNCANQDCHRIFVGVYKNIGTQITANFHFWRFLDGFPKEPEWPKPIQDLKSGSKGAQDGSIPTRFIKTYLQSLQAQQNGLEELAGMGFRKAIEYLVKDWAIQKNPGRRDEIQKEWLGKVISDYYQGDLKSILDRATWLGNDQAHYLKLFGEYDVEDMKELIGLIIVELDRQYKMHHYIENIEKRK